MPIESQILEALADLRPSTPAPIQIEVFAKLREYWQATKGKGSIRIEQCVCEKLGLSHEAFFLALNHAEVMTKGIVDAQAFGEHEQRLYRYLLRQKKVKHTHLLRLFGKTIGGKEELGKYLGILEQHSLIRKVERPLEGKEHWKRICTWYELVEIGKKSVQMKYPGRPPKKVRPFEMIAK